MDTLLFICTFVVLHFLTAVAEKCYNKNKEELLYCESSCCGQEKNRECCESGITMGLIVGSVTGGLALIVFITVIIVCCCVKPKTKTIRRIAVETADGQVEEIYLSNQNARQNRQNHVQRSSNQTLPDVEQVGRTRRHRSRTDHPPPSQMAMPPPPAYGAFSYYDENSPDYEPPPAYKP